MEQDRAQSLLVPQSGYILTQPGFSAIPPIATGFAGYPQGPPSYLRPASHLTVAPPRYQNEFNIGYLQSLAVGSNHPSIVNTTETREVEYRVISYGDLEKLLPDPKPVARVEPGILPDGCAYAPKTATREHYLLFPSKSSYIIYFTHHYFSRENLGRDQTFLSMLVNRLVLPLDKLIKAPRLVAINTTVEDVEQALANSTVVCFEELDDGVRGVRRIDGYPAVTVVDETVVGMPHPGPSTQATHPSSIASYTGLPVSHLLEITGVESTNPEANPVSGALTPTSSGLPFVFPDLPHTTSPVASSSISTAGWSLTPVAAPAASFSGYLSATLTPSTSLSESTDPMQGSLNTVPLVRSSAAVWPPQHPPLLMGGHQRPTHSVPSSDFSNFNYANASLLFGVHPRPTGQASEVGQTTYPFRQSGSTQVYSPNQPTPGTPLSFLQTPNATPPVNLVMAAAMQNPQHNQTLAPNPHLANQLFAAVAAAAQPNQLATALAAAAQQQACFHTAPLHPANMHPSPQQMQRPGSLQLYYAHPSFPLPLSLQRHPSQRMPQGAIYSMQSYQPVVGQLPSDISAGRFDAASGHSLFGGASHPSGAVSYPLLLHHQLPFQHPTSTPTVCDLTTGLSGLNVQSSRSRQPFTHSAVPGNSSPAVPAADPSQSPIIVSSKPLSPESNLVVGTDSLCEATDQLVMDPLLDEMSNCSTKVAMPFVEPTSSGSSNVGYNDGALVENKLSFTESKQSSAKNSPVVTAKLTDDSEDSTSSGIGEMNSACSSSVGDSARISCVGPVTGLATATQSCSFTNFDESLPSSSTANTPGPEV